MLDGLLGRGGFSSKCKSLIKPTKARLEVLRRRAEAKQRFLKEDLAKLLANGLDINAYGRTEEFLAGQSLLSCYNFIEQSCEYLLKQLSIMQKQSECPEECRETVSSLMFAAARFSDLPELRDLRDVFQERYGNALEYFVNQVFVEKLASKPASMEKRLQLLQDIAVEFSIQWDSKGFKQRMANHSTFAEDQPKKHGPSPATENKYKLPNGKETFPKTDEVSVTSKERIEHISDGHTLRNVLRREELDTQFIGRQENPRNKHKPVTSKGETVINGEHSDSLLGGRHDFTAKKLGSLIEREDSTKMESNSSHERRPQYIVNDRVNAVPKGERHQVPLYRGKTEVAAGSPRLPVNNDGKCDSRLNNVHQQYAVKLTGKVQEEEPDSLKSRYTNALPPPYVKSKDNFIPPPYIKPKGSSHGANNRSKQAEYDYDGSSTDPSPRNGASPVVSLDEIHRKPDHPNYEAHGHEKDRHFRKYDTHQGSKHGGLDSGGSFMDPSPLYGQNAVISSDRIEKELDCSQHKEHDHGKDRHYQNKIPLPKPRSIRRKHSKSSSSHDNVESSEDGRIVKRTSSGKRKERKGLQILFDDDHCRRDEEEKMMDKLLLHYSKKTSTYDITKLRKKPPSNGNESPHNRSKHELVGMEILPPPTRSISLPHEQSGESEVPKAFARANSYQPDNQAKHVHPKLPDYDDLAARFAALRGR